MGVKPQSEQRVSLTRLSVRQHVQLLTQIHLLSSPVAQLHSEAETTRQFLVAHTQTHSCVGLCRHGNPKLCVHQFELDLLAQRGELLMSAGYHGYRSIFRASNLQPARRLLEELQQNPISYQPKLRPPDARGYSKSSRGCWEIHADGSAEGSCMCVSSAVPSHHACGAGLALRHPLSLPPPGAAALRQPGPSSLLPPQDQCLHCSGGLVSSRSQTSHTHTHTREHLCVASLLVLGLRNMEGSVDPPKMVSQFLVRKTLVQVRRRILQCCRPGFPDNLVKVTTSVCWAGSGSELALTGLVCRPTGTRGFWKPCRWPVVRFTQHSSAPLWRERSTSCLCGWRWVMSSLPVVPG